MPGTRRKARTIALQVLYEVDSATHDAEETLERLANEFPLPVEGAEFARGLVTGVLTNKERLDTIIQNHAPAWPVQQLTAIDRNILRIAIFEILLDNRVPTKVAINEAVDLAKTFGSDNSSRFVNGVLGSVSAQVSEERG
ncbi:MAG: transcription antitermination factor NusB [Chloroflexota bacterium]|nr:transcription antitermination factor NusB [Chloroflexota bacterium]